jgi:hypothetical protein
MLKETKRYEQSNSLTDRQDDSSSHLLKDLYGGERSKNDDTNPAESGESRRDSSTRKIARRAAYYGSLGMYHTEGLRRENYIKNAKAYWAYSQLQKDIESQRISGDRPWMNEVDLIKWAKKSEEWICIKVLWIYAQKEVYR